MGSERSTERRISKPPLEVGRVACIQMFSSSLILQMDSNDDHIRPHQMLAADLMSSTLESNVADAKALGWQGSS